MLSRLGMSVAAEPANLPGGRVIGRQAFGDVASAGMLCSAEELGLEDQSDGVLELPLDSPLGADVWDILRLDDQAIEVDLTPRGGHRYPTRTRLWVPKTDLELEVTPRLPDQELEVSVRGRGPSRRAARRVGCP